MGGQGSGRFTPGPRTKERAADGIHARAVREIKGRRDPWTMHEIARAAGAQYKTIVRLNCGLRRAGLVEMVTASGWTPDGYPIRATWRATSRLLNEQAVMFGRDQIVRGALPPR